MSERNLDFDTVIDRRGTKCLKYDFAVQRHRPADVLPLWVADMDFKISSYIEDALIRQAQHAIYGYTESDDAYFAAVQQWMAAYHGWQVQPAWLQKTPGVVFAIAVAVKACTQPGDAVLIQQPVYYPFSEVIADNGRRLVSSDLVLDEATGHYEIDFTDFERKIVENDVKLFLLCSPHNPVGRVWSREELLQIGAICQRHGVTVFSDEIHADFVWQGRHQVFAAVDPAFAAFTITATAPSKTFNIAGLQVSNIFIADDALRAKFRRAYNASGYSQLNAAGLIAAEAAYRGGEVWYNAVKAYLVENIAYMREFINTRLPQLRMIEPEGTYLVWVDFRKLGLDNGALEDLILHKAGLWLDSGAIFGPVGEGFQRFNIACPRATLQLALEKLEAAIIQ